MYHKLDFLWFCEANVHVLAVFVNLGTIIEGMMVIWLFFITFADRIFIDDTNKLNNMIQTNLTSAFYTIMPLDKRRFSWYTVILSRPQTGITYQKTFFGIYCGVFWLSSSLPFVNPFFRWGAGRRSGVTTQGKGGSDAARLIPPFP